MDKLLANRSTFALCSASLKQFRWRNGNVYFFVGIRTARIANARADTGSRNILRDQYLKDAVRIDSVKDHFIFSVESVGALTVASLVKEACEILKGRCEYHFLSIGYQLNVKKM